MELLQVRIDDTIIYEEGFMNDEVQVLMYDIGQRISISFPLWLSLWTRDVIMRSYKHATN